MKPLVVGIVVVAGLASAQSGPTVVAFPLDVPRAIGDTEGLRAEFRDMLRKAGCVVPSAPDFRTGLSQLKRADCDRDDACLSRLAILTKSLYGLYASVDVGLTEITVTGRIVRDDGKAFGRVAALKAPLNDKLVPGAIARQLLGQLLVELKVGALPASREVAIAVPVEPPDAGVVAPASPDAGVEFIPPPPPPLDPPLLRSVGTATAIAGGSVALVGGVLWGVGRNISGGLGLQAGAVPVAKVGDAKTANTLQSVGVAGLAIGATVAAAGLVMVFLAPSSGVSVTVAPVPGGSVVLVGGAL